MDNLILSDNTPQHNSLKSKFSTTTLLWLALGLALLGSLTHLAAVFASVDGNIVLAWIQAVAIDAGLFALAYSLQQRKAQGRSVKWTMIGLALFTLISTYANLYYGLQATKALPELLALLTQIKPIVLAATLPVLVLYLSELIASDKGHEDSVIEMQATLQDMQSEREAMQADIKRLQSQRDRLQRQNDVSFGANEQPGIENTGTLDKANEARKDAILQRRETVLTYLDEDMTQAEMAERLQVSPSTIARDIKALNGRAHNG